MSPKVTGDTVVATLPLVGNVTYDEAHAALLGGVGSFAGVGVRLGYTDLAVAFTLVSFVVAFGWYKAVAALLRSRGVEVPRKIESKASTVLRTETWYYTTVYLVSAATTWTAYPLFG